MHTPEGRIIRHTLSLTGSSEALAAAMAAFEAVEGKSPWETTDAPSTSTGAGTPVAPVSIPSALNGAATIPTAPPPPMSMPATTSQDDDEEGDDTGPTGDGSGVDADGLPWDERIHSSNKQKSANGKWMKRRGGPKGDELAAIEAELRAGGQPAPASIAPPPMPLSPVEPPVMAPPAPMPTAAAPIAPAPLPPVEPVAMQPAPAPLAPPAPMPLPTAASTVVDATPAPIPPHDPQPEPAMDFTRFMQVWGVKFGEGPGLIGTAYLQQVCQRYEIGSIADLAPAPEKIPQIIAQFQADGYSA